MIKFSYLPIINSFVVFVSLISFACHNAKPQTNEVLNQNSQKSMPVVEESRSFSHNGNVKWLYIEEPLDFGALESDIISDVGSSKVSVFYQNGEFGRMWVGLRRADNAKTELTAYFDEIVQYGRWKIENGQVNLTIQKCRCIHCDEDHGEDDIKGNNSKDPMPLHEIWISKKGKIGEGDNLLTSSKKKYRLFEENEFVLNNYDAMIAEPLKVKSYKGDRYCIASDLEDF